MKRSGNIELSQKELKMFFNGVQLKKDCRNDIYRIYNENNFIGIGIINNNVLKRDIIVWHNMENVVLYRYNENNAKKAEIFAAGRNKSKSSNIEYLFCP